MTEFFPYQKGFKADMSTSAYLFIICIELLAATVRENKKYWKYSINWERI